DVREELRVRSRPKVPADQAMPEPQMIAVIRSCRRLASKMLARLLVDSVVVPWLSFWARLVLLVQRPLIIGVTGSVGKTTTTRMIATLLRTPAAIQRHGLVGTSQHNMNDDSGLP